ncbi:MAG TPA: hypothetical protein RMH85_08335 [Polyangiaceae bacterium LLY-WYZ-15_(1-7)]|nr:hypothetical protein [Sandaracinus sp.]HJK89827.1 hypothetical protein [Polyangiaceae bacterium LLY-WYZ-15_(1-7)]HJL03962.1 hypothetical protein [Polyangiaceae bacterium LLY-WYZ-15_(1-7)]HJL08491.1 hypothetical protein [Polyangiaceae bacterium LLY-WYZ-15_(1-7)]HJL27722.1 hypothetical protein [Polyangiaceae bacterium LLY-WYZ-15_(1-7)]
MTRALLSMLLVLGCGGSAANTPSPTPAGSATRPADGVEPPLGRLRVNQLALTLDLPLYWEADRDEDGQPDPDEVVALTFYGADAPAWTADGAFTPAFEEAWAAIRARHRMTPPEDARRRLVLEELGSSAPTLLRADLSELPPAHHAFAEHVLAAGAAIDRLYATQVGMAALADQLPDDPASRALFRRNWGAGCRAPTTESQAACSAIPGSPDQPVDVYPASLQAEEGFCQRLESAGGELTKPFTVVREREGELVAVPFTEAYAEGMGEVAAHLRQAAEALEGEEDEAALVAYLRAAAQAFEDNDWGPADEAWSRMNARNSRWYLRVAPDEVYWDPCSLKAGFHMTFARIDRGSLVWQDRLTPIQAEMEQRLAALVPGEYEARDVAFHMPDFIAIVTNHGDDRDPFGATIGQSLPNWGAVAEEGRGRTVAMTNLYTDADSLARRRATAASLLAPETMELHTDDPEPGLLSTILHEATHNLGPAQEYRVDGQDDTALFGGGLASMLEELKAQSGALFFVSLLEEKGILDAAQADATYLDSVVWALGHISRGMYTPSGQRKAYSQLAAIQIGFFLDEGVVRFDPEATAANGEDRGAFSVDFEAFPAAAEKLMKQVMHIKATGDREAAEALAERYVDGDVVPMELIAERYLRQPRGAFVYAVEL